MRDAPEYPYPEDGGRTHYWGCFRERGHHNCAVAEVARLEAEVARLQGELEREKAVKEAALDRHDYTVPRFRDLKAKNARLREALEEIDNLPSHRNPCCPTNPAKSIARRALNRETTDE